MVIKILLIIFSYFLGNISPAIIITKLVAKKDIRDVGSGNAGTTNVLRTLGPAAAAFTLVFDIAKGVIAVLIGRYFGDQDLAMASGLAAFIGHIWPVLYKFRGGKGVATGLGVIMAVVPQISWICLVVGIVMIILTKRVSVGAIIAVSLLPVVSIWYDKMYIYWATILAIIVIVKHRQNIIRIIKGTEPKLSFGKKKERAND